MKTLLLSAGFIFIISSSFYVYYIKSQASIKTLKENITKLELAINEQNKTIEYTQKYYSAQAAALTQLQLDKQQITQENQKLVDKLVKHDLEELSRQKPKLIESRINNGTQQVFNDFTTITSR